jgi:hypothetical protein
VTSRILPALDISMKKESGFSLTSRFLLVLETSGGIDAGSCKTSRNLPALGEKENVVCFLNTKVGQANPAITIFPFQTWESTLAVEENPHPTLEEPIKMYRKKHYIIFFET